MRAKRFGPFLNVPVVLVEDECRSERQLGEVERHPDVDKVCGCSVFPEGLNKSCSLLGSMKFESSSFSSGTACAPSILRARMSRKKKMKVAERQVQKQGVAALVRKRRGQLCYGCFGRFSDGFLHLFAFLFHFLSCLLNVLFNCLTKMKCPVVDFCFSVLKCY